MKGLPLAALATGFALATNALAAGGSTNAAPQWRAPAQWREITPGPAMAKAYLPIAGSTNVVVTVNCLPNVIHPDRPPLVLPRIEFNGAVREGSRSALPLATPNGRATLLELQGRDPDTFAPRRLIVIKVLRTDEEWLYKLMGDSKAVTSQKDAFIRFVQSAQYPE